MDSMYAAKKLAEEFGVSQEDALKALESETDAIRSDPFQKRKPTYQVALNASYDRIRDWLSTGETYLVKLDYAEMARFVLSHRTACVWAVMVAKSRQQEPVMKNHCEYCGHTNADAKKVDRATGKTYRKLRLVVWDGQYKTMCGLCAEGSAELKAWDGSGEQPSAHEEG